MFNKLEKRLSRLEKQADDRTREIGICNCRVETRYHNAACLDAILRGISRVCPVHGFRELGFFFWHSKQYPLGSESDQFCPCPPHPWRLWVLRKGPDPRGSTQFGRSEALEVRPDPAFDLQEDNRRGDALVDEYLTAREAWIRKSGRELPSRQELVKLAMKGARQNANYTQSESL
jgi:hypothetical protein